MAVCPDLAFIDAGFPHVSLNVVELPWSGAAMTDRRRCWGVAILLLLQRFTSLDWYGRRDVAGTRHLCLVRCRRRRGVKDVHLGRRDEVVKIHRILWRSLDTGIKRLAKLCDS